MRVRQLEHYNKEYTGGGRVDQLSLQIQDENCIHPVTYQKS